ncbi:MAG: hypothetical protein KJ737_14070 [Proteobacteria bacterium]|nr:hypothetical protein [Pseudomonadota bacterium]
MTTIMPEGDHIRNAVKWISEEKQKDMSKRLLELIDEASMRYNLSPNDAESLTRILKSDSKLTG